MHRGGTSLVAEIVARWGANGNQGSGQVVDARNPRGYWEYPPLVSFDEDLLHAVDSYWCVPPADDARLTLEALAQQGELRDRGLRLLDEMQDHEGPWFWKDPRLSILLPFWKRVWGPMVYIVAVRDPGNIAVSLHSRDRLSATASFLLWERYFLEIMADRGILAEALFVSYERILRNPDDECARVHRFLSAKFRFHSLDQKAAIAHMAGVVEGHLWRSRGPLLFEHSQATREQKDLYRAAVSRTEDFAEVQGYTPGLAKHWRKDLAEAARKLLSDQNRCAAFWRGRDDSYQVRRSVSSPIQPGGHAQMLELGIPPFSANEEAFLRIHFSRRRGLFNLLEIEVRDPEGNRLWAWDGRLESLQNGPSHRIRWCGVPVSPGGCVLQLDADDSWIEIQPDASDPHVLDRGGSVVLRGIYLAIFQDDPLIGSAYTLRESLNFLEDRLRSVEECLREIRQTGNGAAARAQNAENFVREVKNRLLQLAEVEAILRSRTWDLLTRYGGVALRAIDISRNAWSRLRRFIGRSETGGAAD
jgi:hypothetical protein